MSHAVHLVHPGPADAPTGGSRYNLRLAQALRLKGREVSLHRVEGAWPRPTAPEQAAYAAVLAALPEGATALIDGLVYSAAPAVAREHAARLRLVPIVHLPLAEETGLAAAQAQHLEGLERAALAQAFRVLATSGFTARALAGLGVAPACIWVVEPGVDPAPVVPGGDGTRLLCVAALTPRKAQDVLVEALGQLGRRDWRCTLLGPLDHAPDFVRALRERIAALGLAARIALPGAGDSAAVEEAYRHADVLVLPSRYETYGMVLTEALARGVPIITTSAGAISETVPGTASLQVAPGDAPALAVALSRWLDDPALRERLRRAASRHRRRLVGWPQQAGSLDARLQEAGL